MIDAGLQQTAMQSELRVLHWPSRFCVEVHGTHFAARHVPINVGVEFDAKLIPCGVSELSSLPRCLLVHGATIYAHVMTRDLRHVVSQHVMRFCHLIPSQRGLCGMI